MLTDEVAKDVLDHVKRRLQGVWPRVWKVQSWVTKRNMRGNIEMPYTHTEVFLTESAARVCYEKELNEVKTWDATGHSGHCQFYVPHVFDTGALASWPDEDDYIESWVSR